MTSRFRTIALVFGIIIAAVAAWVARARRHPAACPFGQRFFLDLPRPFLSRGRLREMLRPAAGERLLEIGPGTGYYTLDSARQLAPDGQLDLLDLQQAMLDETMRRADLAGIANIAPSQGTAEALPYPEATVDGAFLVATLGEVPDHCAALRELQRVLKPGGHLVVGEGQPDPHMVRLPQLRALATDAGLHLREHRGSALGFLARFETMGAAAGVGEMAGPAAREP